MGSLIPSSSFAAPNEPLWSPAGGGGGSGPTGPTGPQGVTGATGPTGSGSSGPVLQSLLLAIIGGADNTWTLTPADVGKIFVLSTTPATAGPYSLNFVGPGPPPNEFPSGGSFFIKNMDDTNQILITYNGATVGGNNLLNPLTFGTNNGYLCVAFVKTGDLGSDMSIF